MPSLALATPEQNLESREAGYNSLALTTRLNQFFASSVLLPLGSTLTRRLSLLTTTLFIPFS